MTEAEEEHHQENEVCMELKVYMHCRACEKAVSKTISKLKGVEKVVTDMDNGQVIVYGQVEPKKVLKKLRKKTGKRAEIVKMVEEKDPKKNEEMAKDCDGDDNDGQKGGSWMAPRFLALDDVANGIVLDFGMFSDENTEACTIM